ncbi:MAG: cyclase [Synechococcales cyanobacterium CRU_2_2]|nr:cyclase [Synechococcales cyanobacterium CRU_2_2]
MALSTLPSLKKNHEDEKLRQGEILVSTRPHTPHGGAVTATAYLPISRTDLWQHLTHYPRWTEFFPDIFYSEVSHEVDARRKHILQKARKSFLVLNVEVEVQLYAYEMREKAIVFELDGTSTSFQDFSAELQLKDFHHGTQLSYSVQATSKIPIPALFIEQAMKLDLPMNMRHLRQVLLSGA